MTAPVGTRPQAQGRPRPVAGATTRARSIRPPRPLAALLLLTAIVGVAWSFTTPAFQSPDENSHFGYLQSLAEDFRLPGDETRPKFSTEHQLANSASNAEQAAAQREVPMEWSRDAYERWRAQERQLPASAHRDGGGPNPASPNPPLYYLYEVPAYRLAEGGDIFTRLQFARLASVAWLLVTVLGVWLLAGEVFRRDRLLQLAAAGTAALVPMVDFISASLNPDSMLYALWSLALWLGVRILHRGVTALRAGVFFAVVGAACLAKATSLALIPGALLVLAIAAWRQRRAPRALADAAATGAAAFAGLALTAGVWLGISRHLHRAAAAQVGEVSSSAATAGFNLREFGSYLWQFYLPRLPFQQPFRATDVLPAYDVWLKTGWASFGWLEVNFPGFVYVILAAFTITVAVAALVQIFKRRRTVDVAALAFLAVIVVALLAGLHWTEYWSIRRNTGTFTTGRYLLPLIGVAGLAVAAAVRGLRPSWRPAVVAGTLSGLLVLNLFSLGLVMERFYA